VTQVRWHVWLGGLVLALAASAVAFGIRAASRLPDGPVALHWDKAACACCSMHVGEPRFAAQLTTTDGRTLAFDDPGCLFSSLEEGNLSVHAIWFHHLREDRWLPSTAVAFIEVTPTPMGFGLGAIDPGTPGAIAFEAAAGRCRSHATPEAVR
jgi:hypothetical protein